MKPSPLLVFCAVLGFAGAPAAHAQAKIGLVDIGKVYAAYYKTRDAEKKINEAREIARKELDERMESHKAMLDEINQLNRDIDNPALSLTAKADRSKKREDKIGQMHSLEEEIREFTAGPKKGPGEMHEGRYRNQIIEEIMRVVNEKVHVDKYDLVLDKSAPNANGLPFLLPASQVTDFTDEVVAELNKGH